MKSSEGEALDPKHEQRLTEVFNGAAYNRLLGVSVEAVRRDYGRLRMSFKPDLLHPGGFVHGGSVASLIDTAAALAVFSGYDSPPKTTATIDLHVHYLEANSDEDVVAEAWIRRRGRSVVFVEVDARTDSGTQVAHGELSFRVVPRKEGSAGQKV